jgi:tetratricopeptide (TPR) repeat protein
MLLPDSQVAWQGLAGYSLRKGVQPEAGEPLSRALALEPSYAITWVGLCSLVYGHAEERCRAVTISALERLVSASPQNPDHVWDMLAEQYVQSGDYSKGLKAFRESDRLWRQWYSDAVVVNLLEDLHRQAPADTMPLLKLAIFYAAKGNETELGEVLQRLAAVDRAIANAFKSLLRPPLGSPAPVGDARPDREKQDSPPATLDETLQWLKAKIDDHFPISISTVWTQLDYKDCRVSLRRTVNNHTLLQGDFALGDIASITTKLETDPDDFFRKRIGTFLILETAGKQTILQTRGAVESDTSSLHWDITHLVASGTESERLVRAFSHAVEVCGGRVQREPF